MVEGEPCVKIELELSSHLGDHNHAGCLATAMHVINAIPLVVAAEPGVLTFLDLPVYSGDAPAALSRAHPHALTGRSRRRGANPAGRRGGPGWPPRHRPTPTAWTREPS